MGLFKRNKQEVRDEQAQGKKLVSEFVKIVKVEQAQEIRDKLHKENNSYFFEFYKKITKKQAYQYFLNHLGMFQFTERK